MSGEPNLINVMVASLHILAGECTILLWAIVSRKMISHNSHAVAKQHKGGERVFPREGIYTWIKDGYYSGTLGTGVVCCPLAFDL